jgi:hypothetical protein
MPTMTIPSATAANAIFGFRWKNWTSARAGTAEMNLFAGFRHSD